MTARRTVIDVTQLVHWSGKLSGIPRVMNELAVRFDRLDDPSVVFVAWVKDIQTMCEIDFAQTMRNRGHGISYLKLNSNTKSQVPIGSFVSKSLPGKIIKKAAHAGIAKTAYVSKSLANTIERRAVNLQTKNYKRITLGKGDIIFIPWGEWWDPKYIEYLKTAQGKKASIVPVIHDIGPIVQPQFSGHSTKSLSDYCREVVPIASLVLAVSNNTKADLTRWLKQERLQVPTIKVFREGDDFEVTSPVKPTDPVFKMSHLKGDDFILCVGTVEIKKNHTLLYYVYKLAKTRGIDLPKLLIVGRRGWKTETLHDLIVEDKDVNQDILFMHDTSDEELSWLYDNCLFTVFPSFYEGWGIPIAESVSRGVPCLCSNTSSMIEIAEGVVGHFSPNSSDECLSAIQKWLKPQELAKARKDTKVYRKFSWDNSFKQVRKYLEDL